MRLFDCRFALVSLDFSIYSLFLPRRYHNDENPGYLFHLTRCTTRQGTASEGNSKVAGTRTIIITCQSSLSFVCFSRRCNVLSQKTADHFLRAKANLASRQLLYEVTRTDEVHFRTNGDTTLQLRLSHPFSYPAVVHDDYTKFFLPPADFVFDDTNIPIC